MKQKPLIVVIDQKNVFEAMYGVLTREFYQPEIVHYATKEAAMEFVHSTEKADIIFVDWNIAGEAFFYKVREDIENHNTPVIIMTEGDHETIIIKALKFGITQHLTKPFLDKALIKKINQLMSFQESRRKRRLRPDKEQQVNVEFDEQGQESRTLVDLSCEGCLLRLPVARAKEAFIYHKARLGFNINSYQFHLDAEVSRIGHDYPMTEEHDSVLMMLNFTESNEESLLQLNDMLDDLQAQWHY